MKAWVIVLVVAAPLLAGCADDTEGPGTDSVVVDAGPADGSPSGDERTTDAPGADTPGVDAAAGCDGLSDQLADYANYQQLLACLRDSAATAADKEQAVDAFVRIVEASEGFPIVAQDKVVFVYVRKAELDPDDDKQSEEDFGLSSRAEPIRVAGSFNGWDPSQHTLTHEGSELFHAEITLDVSGKERYAYKLIAKNGAAADVWFSDPLSRRFDFDNNGRYSIIRGGNDAAGKAVGHLEQIWNVHAQLLDNDRRIYLYVPRNYDHAPTKSYPVIYMHDGNNLFDISQPNSAAASWDVDGVANLEIDAGHVNELIAVGIPNNADRVDEYTHTQDVMTAGGQPVGGKGKQYLDFVVNDLKPAVDARYRTQTDKENTAILGSSLGGLISFYAGLQHPSVFKYVGGMSSTLGWGQLGLTSPTMAQLYQQDTQLASYQQVYYLDSGDNPQNPTNPPACPATNEDNYCETIAFRDMLVGRGIDTFPVDPNSFPLSPANINIYHYHQPDAPHQESAWNARLYRPLRLFFRP